MKTELPPEPLPSAPLPASDDPLPASDEDEEEDDDDEEEAVLPGGDSCSGAGLAFAARAVNQLFVAAIACRTAWRPLSSLPFPAVAPSSRSPLS